MDAEKEKKWLDFRKRWRQNGGASILGEDPELVRMSEVEWNLLAEMSGRLTLWLAAAGWGLFVTFWGISFATGMKFHFLLALSCVAGCFEALISARLAYWVTWLDGENLGYHASRIALARLKRWEALLAGVVLVAFSLGSMSAAWLLG